MALILGTPNSSIVLGSFTGDRALVSPRARPPGGECRLHKGLPGGAARKGSGGTGAPNHSHQEAPGTTEAFELDNER